MVACGVGAEESKMATCLKESWRNRNQLKAAALEAHCGVTDESLPWETAESTLET